MNKKITIDHIKQQIEQKYKKYNYIKLQYQEDYILDCVYQYFIMGFFNIIDHEVLSYKRLSNFELLNIVKDNKFFNLYLYDIFKNHCKKEEQDLNKIKALPSYGKNNFFYILNLDVGLGKTIISIITMEIISDILFDIYENEYKTFVKKAKTHGISYENVLKRKDLKDLNISIAARKVILYEFKEVVGKDKRYNFVPSGRGFSKIEEDDEKTNKEFFATLKMFLFINHNSLNLKTRKDKAFYSHLIIHDEFAERKGNQKNNIGGFYSSFTLGLTADIYTLGYRKYSISTRALKTDKHIREELIQKKLYSGSEFLYKFIDLKNDNLREALNKFEKNKEKIIKTFKENNDKLVNTKKDIESIFKEVETINLKDNKSINSIIDKITTIKINSKQNIYFQEQKEILNEATREISSFNSYLIKNFYNDFYKNFENSNLNYLLEENTVLVLDESFTKENINTLKTFFKENDINVYNHLNFRKMTGKSNILIGYKKELIKGLNLQQFDNIIFSFIDTFSINDIYQGIGRLDRIGSEYNKNIVFMSYDFKEEILEEIITQKDTFNKDLKINIIKKTINNKLTKKEKGKFKDIEKIIKETKTIKLTFKGNKKEKERLKEKILFIKENIKTFNILLKDIKNRFDESNNTIKRLSEGATGRDEIDYIESLSSIF